MTSEIIKHIDHMLEHNTRVLHMAKAEKWEIFADEIEAYAAGMRSLCEMELAFSVHGDNVNVYDNLALLLVQQRSLMEAIQVRIDEIGVDITRLRKSHSSALAYYTV